MAAMAIYRQTNYQVSVLDEDDEDIFSVKCIISEDLTESNQSIKKNTSLTCKIDGREYYVNMLDLKVDPPLAIKIDYIYDIMLHGLNEGYTRLYKHPDLYRWAYQLSKNVMIYIDLIDNEIYQLRQEMESYKDALSKLTNGIPKWECPLCNNEKKYIDAKCCCVNCGKIICMDCRGKLMKNRQLLCPFCQVTHTGMVSY